MQEQQYTTQCQDANAGSSVSADMGLDTCRWCLNGHHQACAGVTHARHDGTGCMCSMCHNDHRVCVLKGRKGRVKPVWLRPQGAKPGVSLREETGLFQAAVTRHHDSTPGPNPSNSYYRRPQSPPKLLSDSAVLEYRGLWSQVRDPSGWTEQSWKVVAGWRDDGLSWPQIEQITGRVNVRIQWSVWCKSGNLARFKRPEG